MVVVNGLKFWLELLNMSVNIKSLDGGIQCFQILDVGLVRFLIEPKLFMSIGRALALPNHLPTFTRINMPVVFIFLN